MVFASVLGKPNFRLNITLHSNKAYKRPGRIKLAPSNELQPRINLLNTSIYSDNKDI